MISNTFHFRPPLWQDRSQLNLRTGILFTGTLFRLALYLWLSRHMWLHGPGLGDPLNRMLIALTIGSGVSIAVGWRLVWPGWRIRMAKGRTDKQRTDSGSPALSVRHMLALSPAEFEDYVAYRIFERQGYQVHNTPNSKDGGIDIIITDSAGQQAIVQCKRYKGTVGAATVRELYGTMMHANVGQAYLVTTGKFSREARQWCAGKPIGLIDGNLLARLADSEPLTAE